MSIMTRIIGKQARRPSGLFGKIFSRKMERVNLPSMEWTLSLLQLQPADRVLEVGFGTGALIELASKQVTDGLVAGIDFSPTMVKTASTRNAEAVASGRVELSEGNANNLPYPNTHFDRVYAVNVVYLWPKLASTLAELHRVLKPGGQLALYLAPKTLMSKMGLDSLEFFTMHQVDDVCGALKDIGFTQLRIERAEMSDGPAECVLATK